MRARRVILTAVLATAVPGFIRAQAPTDTNAVRRVVHQWWTTVDPATYGSVHAVEATSIEPDGNVVQGRATLQKEFAADLVNFKGYRVDSVTIGSLQFLGSDHALVQGAFRVVGPRPPLWRYVFLGVSGPEGWHMANCWSISHAGRGLLSMRHSAAATSPRSGITKICSRRGRSSCGSAASALAAEI